jgi:hypothetical protein
MPQRGAKASRANIQVMRLQWQAAMSAQARVGGPRGKAASRTAAEPGRRPYDAGSASLARVSKKTIWAKVCGPNAWEEARHHKQWPPALWWLSEVGAWSPASTGLANAISPAPKAPLLLHMSKLAKVARVDGAMSPGSSGATSMRPSSSHTHARRYTVTWRSRKLPTHVSTS